jgi:pimeloyl-ACP methyl ester carboxylesterase
MDKALKKAGIEEKYFRTGEISMNYVAGPANGTPLVFIPGQSVTWEEYTLLMPKLADRFRVFAVSLRGHGNSSWTPGMYTFNQLGKDMAAFLKGAVGEPAILAGNSSGGVLAAWLAANSPEWVKAIVLEDPPLFHCEWPAIKDTMVYDMLLGYSRMAVAGGGGYARFIKEAMKNMARAAESVVSMKMPAKINQPVLFLHANWLRHNGRLLGALDDGDVARVKSLVKGSWKYVRMKCAHAIALEAPIEEAKEILSWVDDTVRKEQG